MPPVSRYESSRRAGVAVCFFNCVGGFPPDKADLRDIMSKVEKEYQAAEGEAVARKSLTSKDRRGTTSLEVAQAPQFGALHARQSHLCDLATAGLPIASEMLDTISPQFHVLRDLDSTHLRGISGMRSIADAGRLWQDCIHFLRSGSGTIGGSSWQDQQKMDQLRRAYQRAICIPMASIWRAEWTQISQRRVSEAAQEVRRALKKAGVEEKADVASQMASLALSNRSDSTLARDKEAFLATLDVVPPTIKEKVQRVSMGSFIEFLTSMLAHCSDLGSPGEGSPGEGSKKSHPDDRSRSEPVAAPSASTAASGPAKATIKKQKTPVSATAQTSTEKVIPPSRKSTGFVEE
ncbi:MAG: mRNA 3'-end-processing protein rna14 [Phylliscum demangeonii]|nr:MAG: mRNA 3'-end-processing protein rna14 [Phylliscum demangeonii]